MANTTRARAEKIASTQGTVLTKATLRAAEALGLTRADLAAVLGVSAAKVSRLGRGREIPAGGTEGQLAVLFVRIYRSLDTLLGSPEQARAWLHAGNAHLGRSPAELIRTIHGLVRVMEYLDAVRPVGIPSTEDDLVDPAAGQAVSWIEGQGWVVGQ